jgi:hypothetical protein
VTDEQINIAIAESLGWKLLANNRWTRPCGLYADLPNYTADLNAMHEAMLLHPRKELLREFLYLEVLEDPKNTANEPAWATAKQWAKAYITSLG